MKTIDGKYEVLKQLGAGGMGGVYEARHRSTGRRVAVKVILEEARLDPGIVLRFEREARAAGTVESDHITQVLDAGVDAETNAPYLVMELLSGEDLDALLKRLPGPLRPDLALRIAVQMLSGLERAHDAGIVHRDVKPANVFLANNKDGAGIVVKVCDFGIAKVKSDPLASSADEHQLTQSSSLLGSPAYMSPEQAKGSKELDARADVWSAGVVLYQMLTGETPHPDADTLGLLLLAICSSTAPPVQIKAPWASSAIAKIVARALELDAFERWQSARAMLDAITPLLAEGSAAIDRSMLTPLTEDERGVVLETAATTEVAFAKTEASSSKDKQKETAPNLDKTGGAMTTNAVSSPDARTPSVATSSSRKRWPLVIAGAVVIAGAAVLGGTLGRSKAPELVATSPSPSSSALPPASVSTSSPPIAPVAPTASIAPSASVVAIVKPRRALTPTPLASATTTTTPTTTTPPPPTSSAAPDDSIKRTFR